MRVTTATIQRLDPKTAIHTERARLRAALEALMDVEGFTATVTALHEELQALAERARRMGISTDGWIG